jgi:hypothetical protein
MPRTPRDSLCRASSVKEPEAYATKVNRRLMQDRIGVKTVIAENHAFKGETHGKITLIRLIVFASTAISLTAKFGS